MSMDGTSRVIEIVEVAPRDGLQNEDVILGTGAKLELIRRSIGAGVRRIEVASFVNPERVPQMADAEEVCRHLERRDDVSYIGLVLNRRGFERARDAGVTEINVVVVATDTFSERNQATTTEGGIRVWEEIAEAAKEASITATVTIGAAFGCPFEGEVPPHRVVDIARKVSESEPAEICLADTIGVGVPKDVHERVTAVRQEVKTIPLRCHFHNTRNTGLANAYKAVELGVEALDASVGGIGGCPFAPAASGNIPTEDLVYMLDRLGMETSLCLQDLLPIAEWLSEQLGKPVPGMLWRAGSFPPQPQVEHTREIKVDQMTPPAATGGRFSVSHG